jgi:hypothetical protein
MANAHDFSLSPEENERLKQYHELAQAIIGNGADFRDLSAWLADEYEKFVDGKPWQKLFEPRRISPPGGYHSPKNVASIMVSSLSNIGLEQKIGVPVVQTEIQAAAIYYQVLNHNVPVYYVSDAFIRAVAATELPKDFTLHDLHWPMPGMVLGFPEKFIKELTGHDGCYIFCADIPAGVLKPPTWLNALPFTGKLYDITSEAKVAISFNCWQHGNMASYVSAYLKSDRVDEALTKYNYTDFTFADQAAIQQDEKVIQVISSLVFKLLVVLNTRPGLVEPGNMSRPAKVNKKTGQVEQRELWSPNVIGAKYRTLRQPGTGTHASPKWHWRRGHLTHVRIGSLKSPDFVSITTLPRREDGEIDWLKVPAETRDAFWRSHKRHWVEPTLINFEEDEK